MSVVSNRFRVEDVDGLTASLRQFNIFLIKSVSGDYYKFYFDWKDTNLTNDKDEELSFEDHVMPYIKEGEVLIVYDGRHADAYIREGDEVRCVNVSLFSEIKLRAAKEFDIPLVCID